MSYAREKQIRRPGRRAATSSPPRSIWPDEPSRRSRSANPRGRDHAARDFKRHLKVDLGVEAGVGEPGARGGGPLQRVRWPGAGKRQARAVGASSAARAVDGGAARAAAGGRAGALVGPGDRDVAALHGAPLHELAALDVEDVAISARKGIVVVRSGNGDAYREVPLNRPCRAALEQWPKARGERARDDGERSPFVGPQGRRLSPRSVAGSWRRAHDARTSGRDRQPDRTRAPRVRTGRGVILRAG